MRIHASSGTTGKPTVVGYTQNDIDNWANIVARSLRAAGGSPKDEKYRLPMVTACLLVGWVRTMVPNIWALR